MKEEMEEYESPYCEVCGHCGEIGCCGIRNFIEEHIKNKTNCKNEVIIINELISLCEYKDEVFEENKQLKNNWNKLKDDLKHWIHNVRGTNTANKLKYILDKMQELEKGDSDE